MNTDSNDMMIKHSPEYQAILDRHELRSSIKQSAGDEKSLLGTYADVLQLLIKRYAELIHLISNADTLEGLQNQLTEQQVLMQQLLPEDALLTPDVKTQSEIVEDFVSRSHTVAGLILESKGK